ncbi:uncharacterized protein [Montipora capricornis]|uniref:uncharacterized protein n=1 Tax=Montipora capricornis TaxID=246305 RepID=UPI0035F1C39A
MEESESGINLQELSNNDQDEAKKKEAKEKEEREEQESRLMDTIVTGDVEEITDRLNPRALTKCKNNTLYMAMKASSELRRRADKKEQDEEEFTKLANSVDEFSCSLLNPLKSDIEFRHTFADSLDQVIDDAIEMEQKKILAHPVLHGLMNNKWFGEFRTLKRSSWLSIQYWKWCLLNIWCVFDVLLFPVLFVLFYIIHICRDKWRKKRDVAIVFLVNATSEVAPEAFRVMKDSMKYIINKYGSDRAKYHIIIRHPDDNSFLQSHKICFNTNNINVTALTNAVENLQRRNEALPALHKDLQKASEAFESNTLQKDAEKVLIIMTDHRTCLWGEEDQVMAQWTEVKAKQVKVITVAFGPHANLEQLKDIDDGANVLHFGENESFKSVGKGLLHRVDGKSIYDSYRDYFTTPYFVFIRDALSYLVLLGLHFTICLETSSISFTWIEWAILVFFAGRVLFEREQFTNKATVKNRRRHYIRMRCNRGCKYLEEDEETEEQETKPQGFTLRFSKYITDRWNILDLITLVIYFTTFVLRMVTLALSDSVTNNRSLVIGGYFYGLNTMFLTLRAFGHVMETTKQTGPIQIAFFHILSDIATIFWQFIATILAFSIAITKVYVAEKSFISDDKGKELVCNSSGIACWWKMVRHLCWSLLGAVDVDFLESADGPSITLVNFLYGAFLVMGVILLINMMIALLSNTYQKVQDNSLMEWSFKKAITIQTYSFCHPIPVPINLISFMFKCCGWQKCFTSCKNGKQRGTQTTRRKRLEVVVERLESIYFAKYGYLFPLTDERKLDRVLLETERNRQMANQIAQRTFTASHSSEKNILPTGPQAWVSRGISVEECLLTCEGAKLCDLCKPEKPWKYHGARYLIPFSLEFPHFEVLIQETGDRRFLGIGAVWKGYGASHSMPGWSKGTVGYHVDDGKIFHAENPDKGKEVEDAMAYRGDLIGCTIRFEKETDGKVPVVFTLNGRRITEDEIWIDYTPGGKEMYPYIGMGHQGIRVLAKMRPSREIPDEQQIFRTITREKGSRSSDLQLEQLLIAMALNDIKEMKETLDADCKTFKKEMQEISYHLRNAKAESESLESELASSFKRLKKMFFEERPKKQLKEWHSYQSDLERADRCELAVISRWESQEEERKREVPIIVDLLRMIRQELGDLGKKTKEKTDDMLKELAQLKSDAQLQHFSLKSNKEGLDKKFIELEELIQGCCTIKKIPLSILEGSKD